MIDDILVIYLHGFNSSSKSYKAAVLKKVLTGEGIEYLVPDMPPVPLSAIGVVENLLKQHMPRNIVLIGSSLGGYYAIYLAEKFDLRAVLINPAIRPYELLYDYLGLNENIYTREQYELTQDHLDQLQTLEVIKLSSPGNYLLLVQTGDELLDYQQAVKNFDQSRKIITQGGSHGFDEFENVVDDILSFIRK